MHGNLLGTKVSIHASVKDATRYSQILTIQMCVSIHASVKDATAIGDIITYFKPVSIHASVKDATLRFLTQRYRHLVFQSTHL